ncbi:MAG: SUMF1/EgtB/PvdO family nonheme iron enzyme [Deltaproteobacteria bacterium]|nr:SUMF1/EgtB/PvdO family nonheme iron enzyme [Deltaproteobacteria bacterium]
MKRLKIALAAFLFMTPLVLSPAVYSQTPKGAPAGDVLDEAIQKEMKKEKTEKEKPKIKRDLPPIKMVPVKGGCFQMGDATEEGEDDERPAHEVCVGSFYMSEVEVTIELWDAVTGMKAAGDPQQPVTNVSRKLVNAFMEELNRRTKGHYRLPSEAEWEYAAREKGQRMKWAGTDSESELTEYAWFDDNSGNMLHPVKQKKPNKLGLYDMSGNAAEWVDDFYAYDYYSTSPRKNPGGADISAWRAVRGGSTVDNAYKARTTYRYALEPFNQSVTVGFRLAD